MNGRVNQIIWLITLVFLLLMVSSVSAEIKNVPGDFLTIQAAIDDCNDGDVVIVAPGTYFENLSFRGKAISLHSISGPNLTTIKGNDGTVVTMGGPRAEIVGFTITGGRADFGAGIKVSGSSTLIRGNIFDGNAQKAGGYGAAIGGSNASPIIEKNIFCNNTSDNQWLSGVVSFVNSSSPVIRNNIFENNNSNAIVLALPSGNKPRVENNTIVNNRIGIRVDTRVNQRKQIFCNNILVANQNGLRVEHGWESYYPTWEYNLVFGNNKDYVGIKDQTGISGNINADPYFVNPDSNDFHLLLNSPCIDTGDPNSEFGLEPEPDGGRINMGAYGNTPEATCKYGLVLQSYNLVSKTRIGRTEFEYVYTMTLNNNSSEPISGIIVELLDASDNITILDHDVTFAHIAAGESAVSDNTFSIIVDRSVPVDATIISWRANFDTGCGGSGQTTFTTRITLDENTSDITGNGEVDFIDLAELAEQWLRPPGNLSADIAPLGGDGVVNFLDFAELAENWKEDE